MGTFSSNILPNTSGLDLGASNQLWDAFVRNLNFTTAISNSVNPSQSGTIRLAAADTATIRNFANTQDLNLFSKNVNDVLALGGSAGISTSGPANIGGAATVGGALTVSGGISLAGPITSTGNVIFLAANKQIGIVGNGSYQTMYSCTIPANTLPAGKAATFVAYWFHNAGSGNVTYKWTVAGTDIAHSATTSGTAKLELLIFAIDGSGSSNLLCASALSASAPVFAQTSQLASSILSTPISVTAQFSAANTESVTGNGFAGFLIA